MNLSLADLGEKTTITWEQMETVRLLKGAPGTQYQQASDTEKTIMRDWVRSLAQKNEITVTFVKADGTVRDMRCTLDPDLIPEVSMPKGNTAAPKTIDPVDGIIRESKPRKQPDEHSMRVFDLDVQQWRSFRFDRLQKISVVLELTK